MLLQLQPAVFARLRELRALREGSVTGHQWRHRGLWYDLRTAPTILSPSRWTNPAVLKGWPSVKSGRASVWSNNWAAQALLTLDGPITLLKGCYWPSVKVRRVLAWFDDHAAQASLLVPDAFSLGVPVTFLEGCYGSLDMQYS